MCSSLCTIVAHNTVQNRPDNFPSCRPDDHHCSDDVYLRERGETCLVNKDVGLCINRLRVACMSLTWSICLYVWSLGLLDNAPIDKKSTPLDTLSNFLAKRFAYGLWPSSISQSLPQPRLHDTTCCQNGCQNGLTAGCIVYTAGCQTGCQTVLITGLTTGWMFVYTIQPVFKPVVQPVWQPVVSWKRGIMIARYVPTASDRILFYWFFVIFCFASRVNGHSQNISTCWN